MELGLKDRIALARGAARRRLAARLLLTLALSAAAAGGQEGQHGARPDFLDERLAIPESERFNASEYTDSGVGLAFGVDRRLSYLAGNYNQAVLRFEEAIKRYRYKSEIWVYLARAYFHARSPSQARDALQRAAEAMPDLKDGLWDPLVQSLLDQIRLRARALQTQVDYYACEPGDYLNLFRLYTFVEDYQSAAGVVRGAERRATELRQLAEGASEPGRVTDLQGCSRWQELARQLRDELQAAGHPDTSAVAAPPQAATDDVREQARWLQLRIDFYSAGPQDYRRLVAAYRQLGEPQRADAALSALAYEVRRLGLLADTAADAADAAEKAQARDQLQAVLDELRTAAPADTTRVAPR